MNSSGSKHVSIARTEYGSVVLDEARGSYWQLNPSGTLIAEGLLEGRPRTAIVESLVAEFDVAETVAQADVAALADSLVEAGLLREDGHR